MKMRICVQWFLVVALTAAWGCSSRPTVSYDVAPYESLEYSAPVDYHNDLGRVSVALSSAWVGQDALVIRGIFEPKDRGYHLYSPTIPKTGIDGLGRPTLIEIPPGTELLPAGPLAIDQKPFTKDFPELNATFEILPSGRVTLYLPLNFTKMDARNDPFDVQLTFMSCSDKRCNPPVEAAQVTLTPPKESEG